MVYRPTVRYADEFKEYVNDLFQATDLDRNQIIRAALFTAAFSPAFESILKDHIKKDVPLPTAPWSMEHHWLWMEQNPAKQEGGKDVNVNILGKGEIKRDIKSVVGSTGTRTSDVCEPVKRREGQIPVQRLIFKNQGGISIKLG